MQVNKGVNRVSTYVSDGFMPNPRYDMVYELAGMVSEGGVIDGVVDYIDELDDGELTEEQLIEMVLAKYGDDVDHLLEFVENCPDTPVTMPCHPPPSNLYVRVDDVPILDLGSGNCKKVARCQSKSVLVSDKIPQPNEHFKKVLELDASVNDEIEEVVGERVLTSFNVLTQLSSLDAVRDRDGVHVVVDVDYLIDHVGSVPVGDNKYKTGDFVDYKHDIGGDQIIPGYLGVSYYKPNKIKYKVCEGFKYSPFNLQVNDTDYPLKMEWTPKYDGTCMMLVSSGHGNCLKMRNGYGLKLIGDNFDGALYLEKLPRTGPPEAFVLLRVLKYKKYIPFHGLNNLRSFVKNVKIKIGDVALYSPDDYESLSKFDTDGRIYRIGEIDYRYKEFSTFDIIDIPAVKLFFESKGMIVEFEGAVDKLAEYGYRIGVDDIVYFFYICDRHDKTTPTSLKTIYEKVSCEI